MADINTERFAVCSWSLHPQNPAELIEGLRAVGLNKVQLALDPLRSNPSVWGDTVSQLRDADVEIVSGMFGGVNEDYSTLESIRRTGGIVPEDTWEQNWANIQATAALAHKQQINRVSFHAGFVPHEEDDKAGFDHLVQRMQQVADEFQKMDILLLLETGQETAADLGRFLEAVYRWNVGVNFDPANMILYGKGDPVQSVHHLMPHVRQIHIKDAKHSDQPGKWGKETAVGAGDVDWPAFMATLNKNDYLGPLVIEREGGDQRIAEVRKAVDVIAPLV